MSYRHQGYRKMAAGVRSVKRDACGLDDLCSVDRDEQWINDVLRVLDEVERVHYIFIFVRLEKDNIYIINKHKIKKYKKT